MSGIGIDFGTTNSVISVARGENATPIEVAEWNDNPRLMPSIVDCSDENNLQVFKSSQVKSKKLVRSVKRRIGEDCCLYGKNPAELSSVILTELVKKAEEKTGENIDTAVITVPAYFDNKQRLAIKLAASLANVKVLRLINEPTAAAMAYGLEKKKNGLFGIYDLGGGTFDFSILRLSNGVFQVLAVSGDNNLGGDDIDEEIARLAIDRYGAEFDVLSNKSQKTCLLAGKQLKENPKKSIFLSVKEFTAELYITEEELKFVIEKYAKKSIEIAKKALNDAELDFADLDNVVMVGGMTKSLILQELVGNYCKILTDINPDEAVSIGAALYAESILSKNKNSLLIDVTPLSLGVETLGGGVDYIIHRNSPIPFEASVEYTTAEDCQKSIIFNIVQGEGKFANQCRSLGKFTLTGIPEMPARMPRIITTFKIDVNGILSVSAYEKTTGITQKITVEPSEGLSTEDYIKMLQQR